MLTLLTGGSGSGKSAYAEQLAAGAAAESGGKLIYLATMHAGADEDSRGRIARHRAMRQGKGFETTELETDIGRLQVPVRAAVLLEDLPNLLANECWSGDGAMRELFAAGDMSGLLAAGGRRILQVILEWSERAEVFAVTGRVASDGRIQDPETERYIRLLNALGRELAQHAGRVYEVVCGIPVRLK